MVMTIKTTDWLETIENALDFSRGQVLQLEKSLYDIKREVLAFREYSKLEEANAQREHPSQTELGKDHGVP